MADKTTGEARELLTVAKTYRENAASFGTAPAAPGSIIGLWLRTAAALAEALGEPKTNYLETRTVEMYDLAENCEHWTDWMTEDDDEDTEPRDPSYYQPEAEYARTHPLDMDGELALCSLSPGGEMTQYRCPRADEWHEAADLDLCAHLAARRPTTTKEA